MTEAGVTPVDAYLAASVVLGLVLNAVFGWWGDPIAALVIVYYGFEEGLYAWRGVMPKKQLPLVKSSSWVHTFGSWPRVTCQSSFIFFS
jgi:hypothetical protein